MTHQTAMDPLNDYQSYPQRIIPRPGPLFHETVNPRQIRWPRDRIGPWRQSRGFRVHDSPEQTTPYSHNNNNSSSSSNNNYGPWRDSWVMANITKQDDDGSHHPTPSSSVAHVVHDPSAVPTRSLSGGSETATEYNTHEHPEPSSYPKHLARGSTPPPPPSPASPAEDVVPGGGKAGLGQRPACFSSTMQEVSFVMQSTIAMSTTTFLVGVSSIVTASIGRDLNMTQAEISWIAASTTLAAGAFQLAVGQMADLLGRKLMYLVGMGSFAIFVLLVGFAKNPFWMDVVLGVLGISCAMVVPPAGGILGAAYGKPSKRKNLAFAAFSAGNPVGFVFGSIACGVATMLFNVSLAGWLSSRIFFFFSPVLWLTTRLGNTVESCVLVHRHAVGSLFSSRIVGCAQGRGLPARPALQGETVHFPAQVRLARGGPDFVRHWHVHGWYHVGPSLHDHPFSKQSLSY